MRRQFVQISVLVAVGLAVVAWFWPLALWSLVVIGPLQAMGWYDYCQPRQAIRRNFPLLGRFRY